MRCLIFAPFGEQQTHEKRQKFFMGKYLKHVHGCSVCMGQLYTVPIAQATKIGFRRVPLTLRERTEIIDNIEELWFDGDRKDRFEVLPIAINYYLLNRKKQLQKGRAND